MKKVLYLEALSAPTCMLFALTKICFLCDKVQFSVVFS